MGATPDKNGVNFSIFSEHATEVKLHLFTSQKAKNPFKTIVLDPDTHRTYHFWHIYIKNLRPTTLYTYSFDGPNNPKEGFIFDPKNQLVDPYSRGIDYTNWKRDNPDTSLRSVIIDTKKYNWEKDKPLNHPLEDTIIYEMHVGNFTKSKTAKIKHPGKFRGIIEKIPYLKSLGITAVELLPVFDFDSGAEKNNWGYGSLGFFAPESTYCTSPDKASHLKDFRDMVKALHKADIEIILDVAFGFTNERGKDGPILSFKGIDNTIYYVLDPNDKEIYTDFSGCKNTLNTNHPIVSKFIQDCIEFWVNEMHVDGFRFDEASLLTRDEQGNIQPYPHVLWNIELSTNLTSIKIFAEPWDYKGDYLVGKFSGYRFVEWNGRFRDDIRRFIRGEAGMITTIANRITGSQDLYHPNGHKAINVMNFITSHDGFTLNDLVSYNQKHNEINNEGNLDGLDENFSSNYGIEGETKDKKINELRQKQIRNFITLLFLSRGIPMLTMGDEICRTQKGNNNAYCQDNEISWFNWLLVTKNANLLDFTRQLIDFRKKNKLFSHDHKQDDYIFHGCRLNEPGFNDQNSRVLSYTFKNKIHVIINMDETELCFELPKHFSYNSKLIIATDDRQKTAIIKDTYLAPSQSIAVIICK